MKKRIPELLAPAGNMERLMTALHYGADAVYVGMKKMSLRNFADNFDAESLKTACEYAHASGKRVYVACNAFARDSQLCGAEETILAARDADADALIVNDPGIITLARELAPNVPLHLSTQANTLNSRAAEFWYSQGIKRIILARELTLDEISEMRNKLPPDLELEVFVHGAMCVSYSGRCLFSNYIARRDSDLGECAQPCRWSYEFREKGTDGEYFTVEHDELGSYILNSMDMNLIEHLPRLIDTGVCSLKLEGRMKSVFYVATVVNAYRMALDGYADGEGEYLVPKQIVDELEKCSHRRYSTGYALNPIDDDTITHEQTERGGYTSEFEFTAVVLDYDESSGKALLEQRNRFFAGDTLEILSPDDIGRSIVIDTITDEEGESIASVPHPKQRVCVVSKERLRPGDMLRKKVAQ